MPSVKCLTVFMLILTFPLQFVSANDTNKLIISYGDHDSAPYAIEKGEALSSGLIKDIATEIADELDINISFFKTPRKRTERYLENDKVHLVLITNPAWLHNSDKLQWSENIFSEKDVVVTRSDNHINYETLADLKGMIIGTIRGYTYPTLEPYFEKGDFTRYDVSNLQVNFIRLELNRIDALVDADIAVSYLLQQSNNAQAYRVLPLSVSQHNIKAALSPNAPVSLEDFNQALRKLKEQGIIAAILKKYQSEENNIKKPVRLTGFTNTDK